MSFDYAKMAATALRLLEKFGMTVTLVRTTGGSIDPVTGAVVAGTSANQTTTGLLRKYPDNLIDGTRIMTGDRQAVLSNEVRPLLTDRLRVAGEDWNVMGIETVKPTDTTLVYFVQVRK